MNNNFKYILNEWNSFLINESNSSRVLKMIDELESKYKGTKIYIKHSQDNNKITITYGPEYGSKNSQGLLGSISCSNSTWMFNNDPSKKGIGQGEVNSCWYINLTKSTTKGMGPLLYEVLIEFISHYKKASLKPDKTSVSQSAQKVWKTFDDRPDITKIQLDIDKKSADQLSKNFFPPKDIRQITPDNILDDTEQTSAFYSKDTNWSDSFLSRSYKKNSMDLITILKEKGLIVIDDESVVKTFKLKLGKKIQR